MPPKSRRPYCLLPLLLCLLLTACRASLPPPGAAELLSIMQTAMTDTAQLLPEGLIYTRAAPEGTPGHLSDTLLSALYGEAARGILDTAEGGGVEDVALFLSVSSYPCELAVFRCTDTRTAADVAALCRGRLDLVERGFAGSPWQAVAAGGRVSVEGCFVFLVIAEDAARVTERAAEAVG